MQLKNGFCTILFQSQVTFWHNMKNGFNLWRRELKRNTLLHLIEIKYLFPFKMISFFSFDRESSNLRLFSPLLNSISGGSSTARSLKSSTFLLSQFQISALNQCRLPHFIPSIFLRQFSNAARYRAVIILTSLHHQMHQLMRCNVY